MLSILVTLYAIPAIVLLCLALICYEKILLEAELSAGTDIGLPMFGLGVILVCVFWPVTLAFTIRNIIALRNRQ